MKIIFYPSQEDEEDEEEKNICWMLLAFLLWVPSQCASMILQSLPNKRTLGWSPRFWLFSTQWTSCRQSWLLDGGCHLGGPKAVKTSYWMDGPGDMVSRTKKKSCLYQLSNRSKVKCWYILRYLRMDFLLGQNSRNLEEMPYIFQNVFLCIII